MSDARPGDPSDEAAKARVGSLLREKWRLDALLGVGGMAAVYSATHRNGDRVAVKMLHRKLSSEPEVRARFVREGYVANTVGHPGVVRIIDDDVSEDGAAFLVMDLLDGEVLQARAEKRGGKLPPQEVLAVADQLLDVLGAAHAKGIIHRDLKPDNVFVTRDGTVKLIDFGIAQLRDNKPGSIVTRDDTTFGTPVFMPPEQAMGEMARVDAQSDLWAVGAIMFTMIAGRYVHLARTATALLVAHSINPAPPLASVAPGVPAEVAAIVDRALALEKPGRWRDARAMQAAIRAAAASLRWPLRIAVGPGGSSPSAAAAPAARRSRRLAILAAAGALALGGALYARRDVPPGPPIPALPVSTVVSPTPPSPPAQPAPSATPAETASVAPASTATASALRDGGTLPARSGQRKPAASSSPDLLGSQY